MKSSKRIVNGPSSSRPLVELAEYLENLALDQTLDDYHIMVCCRPYRVMVYYSFWDTGFVRLASDVESMKVKALIEASVAKHWYDKNTIKTEAFVAEKQDSSADAKEKEAEAKPSALEALGL